MACAETACIFWSLILQACMPRSVPGGTIMSNKKKVVLCACVLCVRCVCAVCALCVRAALVRLPLACVRPVCV